MTQETLFELPEAMLKSPARLRRVVKLFFENQRDAMDQFEGVLLALIDRYEIGLTEFESG